MTKAVWWSVFTLVILTQGRVFAEAAIGSSKQTPVLSQQ